MQGLGKGLRRVLKACYRLGHLWNESAVVLNGPRGNLDIIAGGFDHHVNATLRAGALPTTCILSSNVTGHKENKWHR